MFEVRDNPELLPDWEAAARGEKVDWDKVFRGYRSQVDWPGARYWRELARHFPKAKVILTVRDPDAWFDSVQATIAPFLAARGKHPSPHVNAIAEMGHQTVVVRSSTTECRNATMPLGSSGSTSPRCSPKFPPTASHIRSARRLAATVRILEVEVPDIPFPKTNSSKEFVEEEWKQEADQAGPDVNI